MLTKYISPPNKLDTAKQGTLCSLFLNDDGTEFELYIQTSQDEQDPYWLSAQELLLAVYKKKLVDPAFLTECLKEYGSGMC